jgi:predicted ribosome quality control (RQC) complex YloA/Tae2 family protein
VHNNFYFLRQLSAQLNERISGYSVVSCFSQNKDELVVELNNSDESFFIKANLSSVFSCLSFPNEFHRARKNSIDLFEAIILKKVIHVKQFENERAFALELEGKLSLIFKMHGNFANVLLAKGNHVEEIFRNHLQADFEIEIEKLNKSIDFSKEYFLRNVQQLQSTYFIFGKVVFDYLKEKGFETFDDEGRWKLFSKTLQDLDKPKYYLTEKSGRLMLSLLPIGKINQEFDNPIIALDTFCDKTIRDQFFLSEKREVLTDIQTRLKNSQAYISKNKQKLIELEQDRHYQLWADLIMANLHVIKQGQEKISLISFYDGVPVEIKLKKELTAQKNAEVFYRKSKNHQLEINKLNESILSKEHNIIKFNMQIREIDEAGDLKSLREKITQFGLAKKTSAPSEPLPYREFEFKNFKIWVGKNAEANDKLTLKYSFKDDLWLHAKDVAGSHVLIKHQAGKNFPKDVIEYAAGLAAFYSKRKNETLCPVAITPKKFVRKRKGDPAGAVVVEREDVILVEPHDGVVR